MKSILCFGDSNTWGYDPAGPGLPCPARFEFGKRWPNVMNAALGGGYYIIEEALNGRTTVFKDEVLPYRSGIDALPIACLSHMPLDFVIIMLGVNDTKHRIGKLAKDIAAGMGLLIDVVRSSNCGRDGGVPEIIVVAPLISGPVYSEAQRVSYGSGREQSIVLPKAIEEVSKTKGVHFFDSNSVAAVSQIDGVHMDEKGHAALGKALAQVIMRFHSGIIL